MKTKKGRSQTLIHDAESLIKFAQALIQFAPPKDHGISTTDALRLLSGDDDEKENLFDSYIEAYEKYIDR